MDKQYSFEDFVKIIARLRDKDGCPWDKEQTHQSLKTCMINEAAEAIAAVDVYEKTGDSENLCEELGDVLLQVILHSQIAEEEGLFNISDVIQTVSEKMIRRHPHVFMGDSVNSSKEVLEKWEDIKKLEKKGKKTQTEEIKRQALANAKSDIVEYLL